MTNPLKTPLFLGCGFLFLLHQLLQKVFIIPIPIADAYLDNLLAMPIILSLLLAERKYLFTWGKTKTLSIPVALLATLYIALISEYIFPLLSPRFYYDPLDLVCYFAGAGLYLLSAHYQKRIANRKYIPR